MLQAYQVDAHSILMGDGLVREVHSKGHLQVLVAPPSRPAGQLARWVTELCPVRDISYGEDGTGQWLLEPDHRKTLLYQTTDGQAYTLGTETEQGSYPGWGDLPSWLTDVERPGRFHNWVTNKWVLDEAAKLDSDKGQERAWRDSEIARITWLRDRHRDEGEQGLQTTLTAEQYGDLVEYIQALRDWPADVGFPVAASRPAIPAWLVA
ncbi:MAG: hypothetical protein KA735_04905 [Burkholderiaceae bacterium]|nr:hypothetical protein [Burkholderiaceae bacterium]